MPHEPYIEDGVLHYVDSSGANRELVLIQDSDAQLIDPQVATRFTNVNLQRRIEATTETSTEVSKVSLHGRHSYRTITHNLHVESGEGENEIP